MTRVVDELVEDALRELSDEATATSLWKAYEGPEVSSLVECTSRLWDDSGLATALDRAVVYSESLDESFRELRAVLHRIDPDSPVDVILANPDLVRARAIATTLLDGLAEFGHDRAIS